MQVTPCFTSNSHPCSKGKILWMNAVVANERQEVLWLSLTNQGFAERLAMWSPPRKRDSKSLAIRRAEAAMRGTGQEGKRE